MQKLPGQDRFLLSQLDALPTLAQSDGKLQALVNEYGATNVRQGLLLKNQELSVQLSQSNFLKAPFTEKIELTNRVAALALSPASFNQPTPATWRSVLARTKPVDIETLANSPVLTSSPYRQVVQLRAVETQVDHQISQDALIHSIETFNKTVGFLGDVTGKSLPPQIKIPISFAPAFIKDMQDASANHFSPLTSYTLEQIGKYGLSTLPDVVKGLQDAGKLSPSFKVLPTTFGIDEFVAGGASHLGRGRMGIEELTHYLDGLSDMTAALAGYLAAGPRGAKIAQSGADLARYSFRGLTMPLFQEVANQPVRQQMLQQWQDLQDRRLAQGLPAQRFSEQFPVSDLRKVGFKPSEIAQWDRLASQSNVSLKTQPIPSYHTGFDRPLTEHSALASMVDKSIQPGGSSQRRALVVAEEPFRANLQQQELRRHGFETSWVSPLAVNDITGYAKQWGADVIVGIRGHADNISSIPLQPVEKLSKMPDIQRPPGFPFPPDRSGTVGIAPLPTQPKLNWDWGKPFVPPASKSTPGGISTEELARAFVDKGNWPVLTTFGLLYQSAGLALQQQGK